MPGGSPARNARPRVGDTFSPFAMHAFSIPGWLLVSDDISSDAKLLWCLLVREHDWEQVYTDDQRASTLGLRLGDVTAAREELVVAGCVEDDKPVIPEWADFR